MAALPTKTTWGKDVSRAVADAAKIDRRYSQGVSQGEKMGIKLDIDNTSIATRYAYPQAVAQVLSIAKHWRAKDSPRLRVAGELRQQHHRLHRHPELELQLPPAQLRRTARLKHPERGLARM